MNAFRRKMGLRIDLILASKAMAKTCTASYVDIEPRRQERPSDHTPVIAEFGQKTGKEVSISCAQACMPPATLLIFVNPFLRKYSAAPWLALPC